MFTLSFPYRVGTLRALINMASLDIYLCGDDTARVLYISGVVCVKFVNRQSHVFLKCDVVSVWHSRLKLPMYNADSFTYLTHNT